MTTATRLEGLTLVPMARLGRVLADVRLAHGATLEQLVEATDGRFEVGTLAAVEAGACTLLDAEIEVLLEAYGMDVHAPLPRRTHLVVDPAEGSVRVEAATVVRGHPPRRGQHGGQQPAARAAAGATAPAVDVLSRYLGLIYVLRGIAPGTPIPLRQADLDTLADALRLDGRTVEERLVKLMSNPNDSVGRRARRFSRRLMVPAAGVLVAAVGPGALVLEAHGDTRSADAIDGTAPLATLLAFPRPAGRLSRHGVVAA